MIGYTGTECSDTYGCLSVTSPAYASILLAVSRDLMYPQTIGAMSRSSFMKPASKSGAS